MEPLEVTGASFTCETEDGREVEWTTFAVEFAFPTPRGKDAEAKLEALERKIHEYFKKGNRSAK